MFQAILPLTKYLKPKSVNIYDFAFVLHCKVTVFILLTSTILVSARQFFGQPIECMADEKNLEYVNLFCWTMGTFILTDSNDQINNRNSIAVGVGTEYTDSQRLYVRYYQWVVIILLIQAFVFYLPAFLWKKWEGGFISQLCDGFERKVLISDSANKERRAYLMQIFHPNYKQMHRSYAKNYFLCEILNFFICILNLTLMNTFFNGFWSSYSQAMKQIPSYNWNQWNEMSSRVFPKITKCEFFKYGGSGSQSKFDCLCVLPINILNEKIFAFLYVWFLILMVVSAMHLTFRIIATCSNAARIIMTQCSVGCNQKKQVHQLVQDMSYSEWFLLTRICVNINPLMFAELIRDLYDFQRLRNNNEMSV
ncbi:innexin inx5-like [Eupeodes corollae]|uniref:innexin inx5-like n=1 Tax=Eupeodes corollae TaxID=290404 RepID=UPI0024925F74|nr:innexin inx5-like [Eupeodes corollae]